MIEVQHLTKRYGETVAVDEVSFVVEPGRVTGFLGPNGAGKSTTMRMILGLDTPSSGRCPAQRPAAQDARVDDTSGAVRRTGGERSWLNRRGPATNIDEGVLVATGGQPDSNR